MKSLNLLALLAVLLLVFSCQKDSLVDTGNSDEFIQNQSSNIQERSVTDCGFIPELCIQHLYPEEDKTPWPPEGPSFIDTRIIFTGGGLQYKIYAMDNLRDAEEYLVVQGKDAYVLTNSQDAFIKTYDKELPIPKGIERIFDLDQLKIKSGTLSSSDVSSILNGNLSMTAGSNGSINISQTGSDNGSPQARVKYNYCDYMTTATVKRYKEVLVDAYDIAGNSADMQIDLAIADAINTCTPRSCYECPDSDCVFNELINDSRISGSSAIISKIKLNYIALLLDLTEEQKDWLEDNPDVLDELLEDYGLGIVGNNQNSAKVGCGLDMCGELGAANAHINLLYNDISVSESDESALCGFYSDLYNANTRTYLDLVESGSVALQQGVLSLSGVEESWLISNPIQFASLINSDIARHALLVPLVQYIMENSQYTIEYVLYNRTSFSSGDGDFNNNPSGGYDQNTYPDFDPSQDEWPTILPVIPESDFIGWGDLSLPQPPASHCMTYAKAQINNAGYTISNYFNSANQTLQIFTDNNGVNEQAFSEALSYLKYALENDIPVLVGLDIKTGTANELTDNTTDHFAVIVGMEEITGPVPGFGKYFTFYDNSTGDQDEGTSPLNRLYLSSDNKLKGSSEAGYFSHSGHYSEYTVTMIRKSKVL